MSAAQIQAERDALACLGLLAHAYARFDVPVGYPGESAPSHVGGLNIHGAVVDHVDGEVLALERNTIHGDGSPLQHGEQRALRTAITRVQLKRPRGLAQSVEAYYRSAMFMAKGSTPEDFLNGGATLYATLEPCPMCASSALVCRVKRVVYLIPDQKYGGAWEVLKQKFYAADESQYGRLSLVTGGSPFAEAVGELYGRLLERTDALRTNGARDTHLLDECRDHLAEAFELLARTRPEDLDSGDPRNRTTLTGFRRALNLPSA